MRYAVWNDKDGVAKESSESLARKSPTAVGGTIQRLSRLARCANMRQLHCPDRIVTRIEQPYCVAHVCYSASLSRRLPQRLLVAAYLVVVVWLNAYICRQTFFIEFTGKM